MENISRRGFVGAAAMGAAAAAMTANIAVADEATELNEWGYPEAPFGVQGLTVEQMNAARREIIDSKTEDYVRADGTVVPNVYVKLRALFDTIGLGLGSDVTDYSYGMVMFNFTEEEAQAVLEMPWGVLFNATEFAVKSGRTEEECQQLCDSLAERGLLFRTLRGGVSWYHLVAHAHGMWEYGLLSRYCNEGEDVALEYANLHSVQWGTEVVDDFYNAETTFYYPIPVNQDVVANDEILPYDDWKKVIARNTVIGVSPCQCRLRRELQDDKAETCDHPFETCLTFGEEAEYYLSIGAARAIDQEEATAIIERSIDAGMVIQSCYSKNTEVICSCHGDCCDILSSYVALGEYFAGFNCYEGLSHYNLEVDKDACLKCGACASRCPLFAITMDEAEGPIVSSPCVRCGQCALVCPVEARKLVQKPEEEIAELPEGMMEDYNLKSSYRLSHGMIH